jgi:hypothetical protein
MIAHEKFQWLRSIIRPTPIQIYSHFHPMQQKKTLLRIKRAASHEAALERPDGCQKLGSRG